MCYPYAIELYPNPFSKSKKCSHYFTRAAAGTPTPIKHQLRRTLSCRESNSVDSRLCQTVQLQTLSLVVGGHQSWAPPGSTVESQAGLAHGQSHSRPAVSNSWPECCCSKAASNCVERKFVGNFEADREGQDGIHCPPCPQSGRGCTLGLQNAFAALHRRRTLLQRAIDGLA